MLYLCDFLRQGLQRSRCRHLNRTTEAPAEWGGCGGAETGPGGRRKGRCESAIGDADESLGRCPEPGGQRRRRGSEPLLLLVVVERLRVRRDWPRDSAERSGRAWARPKAHGGGAGGLAGAGEHAAVHQLRRE